MCKKMLCTLVLFGWVFSATAATPAWSPTKRIIDRAIYTKIASCSDGQFASADEVFVAVGEGGRIATSKDGHAWLLRDSLSSTATWYGVSSGPDHSCVAVGQNGQIAYSFNGAITWATVTVSKPWATDSLYSVATDGQTVMVGGERGIYVNNFFLCGVNKPGCWEKISDTSSPVLSLSYSVTDQQFLAMTRDGVTYAWYFSNSDGWSNGANNVTYFPFDPNAHNAAVSYGLLASRADAYSFYLGKDTSNRGFYCGKFSIGMNGQCLTQGLGPMFLDAVVFDSNNITVVGQNAGQGSMYFFNVGIGANNPPNTVSFSDIGPLSGVAFNLTSSNLVAVGPGYTVDPVDQVGSGVIARTTGAGVVKDTITPRSQFAKPSYGVDPEDGQRRFFVGGKDGLVLKSTDGFRWDWSPTRINDYIRSIASGTNTQQSILVAVASNGAQPSLLVNKTGLAKDWYSSNKLTGTNRLLNDIAYNPQNKIFLAVGEDYSQGVKGVKYVGTDVGLNTEVWWDNGIEDFSLHAVAFIPQGQFPSGFCAVGNSGFILTMSANGQITNNLNVTNMPTLNGIAPFDNKAGRFYAVVVGSSGTLFLVDDSCNPLSVAISLPTGFTDNLYSVSCADSLNASIKCTAVGSSGKIISSTSASGMTNWVLENSNSSGNFTGVTCPSLSGNCVATGNSVNGEGFIQQNDHIFSSSFERFEFNQ